MATAQNAKHAQIELWMLTKIAMLFFIISLAYIAFNISNQEKSALCGSQASATARIIATNINQVLSSSAEDMRLVYRFEPSIAVSREKFGERYSVNISTRQLAANKVQLSVTVSPYTDSSCQSRVFLFFDSSRTSLAFYSSAGQVTPDRIAGEDVVTFKPSLPDFEQRSKFLVIVKCTEKKFAGHSTIYFDDCTNTDPAACSPLEQGVNGEPAAHLVECKEEIT